MSMSIKIKNPARCFNARAPKQKNSPRCKDCRHFAANWCSVFARCAVPLAGMCEYGYRCRASEATINYLKSKTKKGKSR